MNAKRCDRCLCCFDPADIPEEMKTVKFRNPMFMTAVDYKNGKVTNYYNPDPFLSDYMVDLCPSCTEDFIEFMDFPDKRLGYIQDYETEVEDLRKIINETQRDLENAVKDTDRLGQIIFEKDQEINRLKATASMKNPNTIKVEKENQEFKDLIKKLIENIFGANEADHYLNRKQNTSVNGDQK